MVVIDTSAVLAILCGEPEHRHFNELVALNAAPVMSAGTYGETEIVTRAKFGAEGVRDLKAWMTAAGVEIVPFDAEQAFLATEAYTRFGKGRHPAALNFGDCFAYALANHLGAPLLFKGRDFELTDITSATHG